jgi:hypothetical protein
VRLTGGMLMHRMGRYGAAEDPQEMTMRDHHGMEQ